MADSVESFSWPEMLIYAFTGSTSGIMAFAQDVSLTVTRKVNKYLFMPTGTPYAARTQYVEADKNAELRITTMYAGASLFGMLSSGANISATLNFLTTADGSTSTFTLWSAQMTEFTLQGSEGNVMKGQVRLIAPDISGL